MPWAENATAADNTTAAAAGGAGSSSPPLAPLSAERIDAAGWYLFDDGPRLFLWAGRNAPPAVLFDLFAVPPQHLAAASAQQPGGLQLRRPAAGEQAAAGGGALGPAAAAWALVATARDCRCAWARKAAERT
jgi:hypothetical protein